jgi:hypothetical protein
MAWRVSLRTTFQLHSLDLAAVPMPVELVYDSRAGGVVRIGFAPPRGCVWVVARDLLRDGRFWPVAVGDVQVRPSTSSSAEVVFELGTADGLVMFGADVNELTEFVCAVYGVVPAGHELDGLPVAVVELPALAGGGERR